MLFKVLKIDETSKGVAQKLATFNLVVVVLIICLLTTLGLFITRDYDDAENMYVGRLVLVEVGLHLVFVPFTLGLVFGVKADSTSWVRWWIIATIFQTIFLLVINIVIQVYISVNIDAGYGVLVLIYAILSEGIVMAIIIYFISYYRKQMAEQQRSKAQLSKAQEAEAPAPDNLKV